MIQVEHLTKCYGDVTAVDDLSFEIEGVLPQLSVSFILRIH